MEYGRVLTTRGVADEMEESSVFAREVAAAFNRYRSEDWGELSLEDKEFNDQAIEAGERILAAYQTSKGRI